MTTNSEEVNRYRFIEGDKIVGEFTPIYEGPAEQAIAYRNKHFPNAQIFTMVWEYPEEKEVYC